MAVYELEQLTSPELRSLIDGGLTTVVLPIGSIEQHGKHMPLGTGAMLGDEIGRQAAERLRAVLAPTLRVGCAAHHVQLAADLGYRLVALDGPHDVMLTDPDGLARELLAAAAR